MSFPPSSRIQELEDEDDTPVRTHHVVLIDDDASIREGLSFFLEDNFRVTACASADEGLCALNEDVCTVILDVRMPGQDGFQACSRIRQKFPDIPVIFYSAYQDMRDPYSVINDFRPFGYLVKGDSIQKLIDLIEQAVKLYETLRANRPLVEGPDPGEGSSGSG